MQNWLQFKDDDDSMISMKFICKCCVTLEWARRCKLWLHLKDALGINIVLVTKKNSKIDLKILMK